MVRKSSKEQRDRNLITALSVLKDANLTNYQSRNNGYALIFRETDMPAVDYYPSTGKWRCNNKTYFGTASDFVEWYMKCRISSDLNKATTRAELLTEAFARCYESLRASIDALDNLVEITKALQDEQDNKS